MRGTTDSASADPVPLVWFPGVGWDEVTGTDRLIVEAIARTRSVIWLDPPNRAGWDGWLRGSAPAFQTIGAVRRVQVPATLGVTRWPLRAVSRWLQHASFARATRALSGGVVVVANPLTRFPSSGRFTRVLYVTDDWIEGASMMGVSRRFVERMLHRNIREADAIAVVSPELVARIEALVPGVTEGRRVTVIPNGAPSTVADLHDRGRLPIAGVIGQLNERLDLAYLKAVVDAGIPLRLVGPRTDRQPEFSAELTRLMGHPLVDWRGAVAREEVPDHLAEIGVGLTPYADTPFNRASSPLKTLEYLAAGVGVVSTELPASRWFASPHVRVETSPASFACAVELALAARDDRALERDRREFAGAHSWDRRGASLVDLVERSGGRADRHVVAGGLR
ncbi:glycosyltransferase [Agromyces sp. Leaf222]|uniref:glycosyltransferase n=1 Tax=Agromyces sp. Leaf222 TaxID=1735688 RepID=UPI0006FE9A43|nr:glycosyltransferase [Agromyces sp. Leaf222]KQM81439.1 hypothetical protein ASE68_16900 [Agromyces sp. Leaf222]